MPRCETCGNDDEQAFTVQTREDNGRFDSFACAIRVLAPRCPAVGCCTGAHGRISGCAHCASHGGEA